MGRCITGNAVFPMWSLRDDIQSWSLGTRALSAGVSNYLIWISFGEGPFVTDLFIACQRALPPISPRGASGTKGKKTWTKRKTVSADHRPVRLLLHHPPHPPLVSIYGWVNLLTDVPAWRTSTGSLRYLMAAPSAQHVHVRHMLTPCGATHTPPESVENTTNKCALAALQFSDTELKDDWEVSCNF